MITNTTGLELNGLRSVPLHESKLTKSINPKGEKLGFALVDERLRASIHSLMSLSARLPTVRGLKESSMVASISRFTFITRSLLHCVVTNLTPT